MDYEKLTIKAQEAVNEASAIAQRNDHSQVEVEHLLLALLNQEDGIVGPLIERIGADPAGVKAGTEALIAGAPKIYGEYFRLVKNIELKSAFFCYRKLIDLFNNPVGYRLTCG
jgi:ATP-dependent Clp protease ATP-binding subunit ClpB